MPCADATDSSAFRSARSTDFSSTMSAEQRLAAARTCSCTSRRSSSSKQRARISCCRASALDSSSYLAAESACDMHPGRAAPRPIGRLLGVSCDMVIKTHCLKSRKGGEGARPNHSNIDFSSSCALYITLNWALSRFCSIHSSHFASQVVNTPTSTLIILSKYIATPKGFPLCGGVAHPICRKWRIRLGIRAHKLAIRHWALWRCRAPGRLVLGRLALGAHLCSYSNPLTAHTCCNEKSFWLYGRSTIDSVSEPISH
jgi:hypothetical protein